MQSFELEQVDGCGPIELPRGETVLGRGPFLGVNDKRVSRNHCIVENENGLLRLKPTHLNPCFIQPCTTASPQPLEKDEWHCLQEGDIFSLLPEKYIYRVHMCQHRDSQAVKHFLKCSTDPTDLSEESTQSRLTTSVQSQVRQQEDHVLPEKKRVLPPWMMSSPALMTSSPAAKSPTVVKATKTTPAKTKRTNDKTTATPKRARITRLSSEDEEEIPKTKAKRLKSDPEDKAELLDDPGMSSSRAERSVQDSAAKELKSKMERESNGKVRRGDGPEDPQTRAEDSCESQGPSHNSRQGSKVTVSEHKTGVTSKVKKRQRTPCPYGGSCYRKNPTHFQESSHPGDSDYEEEDAGDDDNRPECPYGTSCYRKNPLHKKEYKHTKSPPKSSPEDDDQYEDSFINDESEDEVDEDSDYVPESEDSGKEDIRQLQKEAKAFLQKKRR